MNNPIQINYWTIGGFDGAKPLAQAMAEAKAMGCDGLELTFGAGHFAPGISDAACRGIRTEARKLKLRIESVATGGLWDQSLSDPRPAVRRKAIAFTREYFVQLTPLAPKSHWSSLAPWPCLGTPLSRLCLTAPFGKMPQPLCVYSFPWRSN